MAKRGRKVTLINPKVINLKMPGYLFDAATQAAEAAGLERAVWIRRVISRALDNDTTSPTYH